MAKNSILFICGGSGGHIIPCIALAEYFSSKQWQCYFLVSDKSVDLAIMQSYPFPYTTVSKIKTKSDYFFSPYLHLKSVKTLFTYLTPDIVFTTGSIYSFWGLLYSLWQKIPFVLFEPNTIPGRVNTLFFRYAKKVFTGWKVDYSHFFFGRKTITSGIPIRKSVKVSTNKVQTIEELGLDKNRKTILIVGGSQGSEFLNNQIIKILANAEISNKIQIILLSSNKFPKEQFDNFANIKVLPFTLEVGKYYDIADLVICRSGAITLAEICFKRIPSISIPFPLSANNHQLINAKFLESKGLTFCIEQEDVLKSRFIELVKKLLFNDNLIGNLKKAMEGFFIDNAEETIYKNVMDIIGG